MKWPSTRTSNGPEPVIEYAIPTPSEVLQNRIPCCVRSSLASLRIAVGWSSCESKDTRAEPSSRQKFRVASA
ncbi:MAG: hypothetical protein DMF63_05385 [Acidobacteria bacterium]|nr:MAG: hypothetical protein DMF63_05385 [Acidobacteriota bacterium]